MKLTRAEKAVLLLTALLLQPLSAAAFMLVAALGALCCALLDFRIGYMAAPSVFELVRYVRAPLLFFMTGTALAVLLYFACRWLAARRNDRIEENNDESA